MKTVLITAYAVDPYEGSEAGMGWNFIHQVSRRNKVIAITRKNNKANIEKFIREKSIDTGNLHFYFYDLPRLMRFWKKGQRGSSLYFYLWQCFIPLFIHHHKFSFDIAHNLNFHTDWAPSLLWVFGKPLIWGPIGHHHKIPAGYVIKPYGIKAYLKGRAVWLMKLFSWRCDLLLRMTKQKADAVLCMNTSVQTSLRLNKGKVTIFPSVGSESRGRLPRTESDKFTVLSVGRFVPLKGFDIVIRSFRLFCEALSEEERGKVHLILVGKGPRERYLRALASQPGLADKITFINWLERERLSSLYSQAKLFFFPSHEGAGMVIAEALSFGVPVLCFDNYGPGEFVDRNCGVKIAYSSYEKSIREFADALRDLYRRPDLINALSTGALDKFHTDFDWERKGELLQEIYSNISRHEELSNKNGAAFLSLPSRVPPKYLISLSTRKAYSAGLSFYPALSYRSRFKKRLLERGYEFVRMACSAGLLGHSGDEKLLPVYELLKTLVPSHHTYNIYVPSYNKAIVQAVDASGRCEKIIKVALSAQGRRDLRREADNLAFLSGFSFRSFEVPTVKDAGVSEGVFFVEHSCPEHYTPFEKMHCSAEILTVLAELFEVNRSSCVKISESRLVRSLEGKLSDGKYEGTSDLIEKTLSLYSSGNGDIAIPLGIVHSDFKPWNMLINLQTNKILLVDWELMTGQGFPLWDAYSYVLFTYFTLRYNIKPQAAMKYLNRHIHFFFSYADDRRLDRQLVFALLPLYLCDLLTADQMWSRWEKKECRPNKIVASLRLFLEYAITNAKMLGMQY